MRTMRNSTSALRFIVDVRCDTRFRDKSGHKVARSGLSGECENGMTNGAFVLSCPIRNVAPKQIFSRFWNGRRRSIAFLSREKKIVIAWKHRAVLMKCVLTIWYGKEYWFRDECPNDAEHVVKKHTNMNTSAFRVLVSPFPLDSAAKHVLAHLQSTIHIISTVPQLNL